VNVIQRPSGEKRAPFEIGTPASNGRNPAP
jgi:hypothetical protein